MANIFETARAEHAYNKYIKGLESVAGLVDTLTGPGPFTIFVPTDAAFDSLSDDQQANMFADPGKLARVLKYHIVPGYYTATVTTSVRESIKINGGHVTQANLIADNGIIHVIDKVLIPQFTML